MRQNLWVVTTLCVSLPLLASCEDRPISFGELVGRYDYHLENFTDKAQGTTCFTLNQSGTFTTGNTNFPDGLVLPRTGRWVVRGDVEGGQEIILERAGFPLRRHHSSVRALVNDDLGYFCEQSH